MSKYLLSNKAVNDLSKIWDYTYEVWSENQADKYYFELLVDCQELAGNHLLGKNYDLINKDLFGYQSGQHLIFYRVLDSLKIEIIRILHSSMDLKKRVQE
jgi:toxin ParE1/3/4